MTSQNSPRLPVLGSGRSDAHRTRVEPSPQGRPPLPWGTGHVRRRGSLPTLTEVTENSWSGFVGAQGSGVP